MDRQGHPKLQVEGMGMENQEAFLLVSWHFIARLLDSLHQFQLMVVSKPDALFDHPLTRSHLVSYHQPRPILYKAVSIDQLE